MNSEGPLHVPVYEVVVWYFRSASAASEKKTNKFLFGHRKQNAYAEKCPTTNGVFSSYLANKQTSNHRNGAIHDKDDPLQDGQEEP